MYLNKLKHIMTSNIRELVSSRDGWRGYFTKKRNPTMARIYKYVGKDRLCIHNFYDPDLTGEDSDLHIHGWPMAACIIDGSYRMELGKTNNPDDSNPVRVATIELIAGSYYDMITPMIWHRVIPLTQKISSVMLNGPPWEPMPTFLKGAKEYISTMSDDQVTTYLDDFKNRGFN
jgi:hypothetical protein